MRATLKRTVGKKSKEKMEIISFGPDASFIACNTLITLIVRLSNRPCYRLLSF